MSEPRGLNLYNKMDIITLSYYHDLTTQQIATNLSLPLEQVEGYLEYTNSDAYNETIFNTGSGGTE